MDNISEIQPFEKEPELFFKVTLMRHEKPFYKDEGHDLKPDGVARAIKTGERFKDEKIVDREDEIILVHSPKPRAKGTLGFVADAAGIGDLPRRAIDQLRSSDIIDEEVFMNHVKGLRASKGNLYEDHYKNPMYEDRPDIIEPNSNKRERLYRSLEYLIRWFDKHPTEGKTPHVIAVSHFEIITHLVDDVFGIESVGRYGAPALGESVHIEAYKTDDEDRLKLRVDFGGMMKEVFFDRKSRSVVVS